MFPSRCLRVARSASPRPKTSPQNQRPKTKDQRPKSTIPFMTESYRYAPPCEVAYKPPFSPGIGFAKDRLTLPDTSSFKKGISMKVNYQGLATSAALSLAVLLGALDVTNAQGRRGRGKEVSQENQEQKDTRKSTSGGAEVSLRCAATTTSSARRSTPR